MGDLKKELAEASQSWTQVGKVEQAELWQKVNTTIEKISEEFSWWSPKELKFTS